MFFRPAKTRLRPLPIIAIFFAVAARLLADPAGPTLQLDYGNGQPLANPLGHFMYFVPLISPEQVSVFTNAGNTQCARVTSFHCRTNGAEFRAVCEFEFTGEGLQRSVFDHAFVIRRREKELQAGKPLAHQLAAINVEGAGSGSVEIDGALTNGQPVVAEMRLRFNSRGHASPVSISLQDISRRNGEIYFENEMVARVNLLTFRQKSPPKMEVTLASVKRQDAGNGVWQNFVGDLKGAAANLLLPPLNITTNGQQAMLDFGLALAAQKPAFTFPFASRLKDGAATKQTADLR
jgi:hypothetical protein